MTYIVKPLNSHPNLERNHLGLTRRDYEGTISTLCAGCGHDSVSAAIIEACYDLSLSSDQIAKLSGYRTLTDAHLPEYEGLHMHQDRE